MNYYAVFNLVHGSKCRTMLPQIKDKTWGDRYVSIDECWEKPLREHEWKKEDLSKRGFTRNYNKREMKFLGQKIRKEGLEYITLTGHKVRGEKQQITNLTS